MAYKLAEVMAIVYEVTHTVRLRYLGEAPTVNVNEQLAAQSGFF
jgi:hypothetical protein